MNTPVIIIGALGRMGSMLVRMVQEDPAYSLVGAVVLESQVQEAAKLGCPVSHNVRNVLAVRPDAVVIDFTSPETSLEIARAVAEQQGNHVIGTTGLTPEQKGDLEVLAGSARIFWSPNMSVGVNVLLRVLPELTRLLGDQYDIEMVETHHNKKRDSPSGTALHLAECLAGARDWNLAETACYHREGLIGERPQKEIGIQTLRGGDVVGDHTIYFFGAGERISVTHQAHSRENFAKGALRAAAWLTQQAPGKLFAMQDML